MNMLVLAVGLALGQSAEGNMDRIDRLTVAVHRLETRIDELERENELLRERIERLEEVLDDGAGSNHASEAIDPDATVAQLIRVESVSVDEETLREAERLEAEAEAYEDNARSLERDAAELQRRTAPRHLRGEARRRWEETERVRVRRERRELRNLAREENRKARERIGRANQLRREAEVNRQLITAWDGDRMLTLETERDFTRQITIIEETGGYFMWDGSLIETTGDGAHYLARRINPAAPPSEFADYED